MKGYFLKGMDETVGKGAVIYSFQAVIQKVQIKCNYEISHKSGMKRGEPQRKGDKKPRQNRNTKIKHAP